MGLIYFKRHSIILKYAIYPTLHKIQYQTFLQPISTGFFSSQLGYYQRHLQFVIQFSEFTVFVALYERSFANGHKYAEEYAPF